MEPRSVTATPDPETGGIKVWSSTQNVFGVKHAVASTLGLEESKVRVLAEDVGGGFGAKGSVFPGGGAHGAGRVAPEETGALGCHAQRGWRDDRPGTRIRDRARAGVRQER